MGLERKSGDKFQFIVVRIGGKYDGDNNDDNMKKLSFYEF